MSRLERLFYVEVKDCQKRTPQLFISILAHPIVNSVLVHELPLQSMQKGDLSKVTLNDKTLRSRIPLDFMKCLRHGMRVANLLLFSSEILGTLNLGTVSGLETIHVGMDRDSISLFWTVLLSTPSNIKEVWFFDKKGLHDVESKRQGLNESFNIMAVGLGGATGHSHQWDIVNLSFKSTTSLLSTLALAASLFPKLEVLTLNLSEHEGTYDIADFVLVVAHFSFLKTIYLLDVLWRLEFKSRTKSCIPTVGSYDPTDALEFKLISDAGVKLSLLAKQVRTLDSFFIYDAELSLDGFMCSIAIGMLVE
ncbi:hypothetical protein C8R42DRAFT_641554 [Lentinula raphanica]|nr:hypothetical protein C8R42DRAFT_641554 [Lentinula raphanica]